MPVSAFSVGVSISVSVFTLYLHVSLYISFRIYRTLSGCAGTTPYSDPSSPTRVLPDKSPLRPLKFQCFLLLSENKETELDYKAAAGCWIAGVADSWNIDCLNLTNA